jgi:hypothetical protein
MALSTVPIVSGQIYLRDLSDTLKALEGKCKDEHRAWVMIRQATEGDVAAIELVRGKGTVVHGQDGSTTEMYDRDTSHVRKEQFKRTVVGVGNISDAAGSELFKFKAGPNYAVLDMTDDEFSEAYDALPRPVTNAFGLAILESNPQWDLRERVGESGEG